MNNTQQLVHFVAKRWNLSLFSKDDSVIHVKKFSFEPTKTGIGIKNLFYNHNGCTVFPCLAQCSGGIDHQDLRETVAVEVARRNEQNAVSTLVRLQEWEWSDRSRWAMKKKTGCLGYIGDEKLPSYIGIIS